MINPAAEASVHIVQEKGRLLQALDQSIHKNTMSILESLPSHLNKADFIRAKYLELFTEEERGYVKSLMDDMKYDCIGAAIDIDTPEKEEILNAYINLKRPSVTPGTSKVREELQEKAMRGEGIETPEEEAEWQKKIDEEENSFKKDVENTEEAIIEPTNEESTEEKPTEESETKAPESVDSQPSTSSLKTAKDYREALTNLGVSFKSNASKPELVALYEEVTK